MGKEYYVLYGSQTGNAEFIAKEVHSKLCDKGLPAKYATCNDVKKTDLKELAHAVIIVCSTTGNGDSPENSDAFWRWIKSRALPKNQFEGLPFAVLGLGDTNYDKFCFMGKSIDKRMGELGGRRMVDLQCADEPTNLEEVVEAWKINIVEAVQQLSESLSAPSIPSAEASIEEITSALNAVNLSNSCCHMSVVPDGVQSAKQIWTALALEADISVAPITKMLPGGAATSVPDRVEVVDSTNLEFVGSTGLPNSQPRRDEAIADHGCSVEWSVDKPFYASVAAARYLTGGSSFNGPVDDQMPWGEEKKVIEATVCLDGSHISYEPGDSIAICCPNPDALVSLALARLNASLPAEATPFARDTLVRKKNVDVCALEELLAYKIDLVGVPRKAGVMRLSMCCRDAQEASLMQHVCSKGDIGKKLWRHFVENQGLGVGELLALFPSCLPSLDQLVAACGTMPPRCYSIASSPLRDPNAVRIAFSVVKYTCNCGLSEPVIRRSGVCTNFLETLLEPWLNSTSSSTKEKQVNLRVFHKPTINFKLPGSPSYPLILIGPGTGVAPFVGFLEQREALEKERTGLKPQCLTSSDATAKQRTVSGSNSNIKFGAKECCMGEWRGGIELEDLPIEGSSVDNYLCSVPPGPIWLFFGCRSTKDFLFQEELQHFVHSSKTLDQLEIAFSRMSNEKVYVQHKIREKGAEMAALILNQNAYVYICGDGNKMAKDVEAAIVDVLVAHGVPYGVETEADAKSILSDMRQRRKFVLDIWS